MILSELYMLPVNWGFHAKKNILTLQIAYRFPFYRNLKSIG